MAKDLRLINVSGNFIISEDGLQIKLTEEGKCARLNLPSEFDTFSIEFIIYTTTGGTIGIGNENHSISYPGYNDTSIGITLHSSRSWYNSISTVIDYKPQNGSIGCISVDKTNKRVYYYLDGVLKYERNIPFSFQEIYLEIGTGSGINSEIRLIVDPDEFVYEYPIMTPYVDLDKVKYLIKQSNRYFTYQNEEWKDLGYYLENIDIRKEGFRLEDVPEIDWQALSGDIEVLMYTDEQPEEEIILEIHTEPFTPLDLLGEKPKLLVWTDEKNTNTNTAAVQKEFNFYADLPTGRMFKTAINPRELAFGIKSIH